MNFGLICDDPSAAWLISALRQQSQHAVTMAVLVSSKADDLLHGLTGVKYSDRWEDLLAADNLDAVIVGGNNAVIWDAARQLASASIPLIVLPSVAQGPAILYELSLIRDDRRSILVPVWPHRFDPLLRQLRDVLQSADRPKISFLKWERTLALGPGAAIPQADIEAQLLQAADLIRFLFGAADYVTALRTGGTETGALIQSVVLAGRIMPESTWTIQSSDTDASRLTLQTPEGPWKLAWDAQQSRWMATEFPAELTNSKHDKADIVTEIAAVAAGEPGVADWPGVLHAAEILDAAKRSLERRRTIDLNHEPLSERVIFKTQMAAMGCTVLMMTLAVLFGFLLIDSLAPLNRSVLKFLLVLAAVPMFGFLLFQFLLPLTRTAGTPSK